MKKRGILIGFFLLLAFFFLAPTMDASAYGYTIEKYHINIRVTTQNIYQIEETISVHFNQSYHGIYRDIPLVNKVERTDGSKNTIHAKIKNIRCGSDDFDVSREGDDCEIKIGDEDETIIGDKEYHITYDYEMGNDVLPDSDEFYFNVTGNRWKTTIQNVSFTIQMPKEFEEKNLGMSWGSRGSTNSRGLSYICTDNKIEGMLDSDIILRPGYGVNVRLTLPEGYFDRVETTPWLAYISIIIGFVAMAVGFFLWWIYGRDDPVVEAVEFYPPDGLNSVELAFAFKGKLDSQDVVSLIVYLAQKGYIEIQEGTGGKQKKGFTLIQKKAYDGSNEAERIFMEGLFRSGSKVTKSDLENSFYKTINIVKGIVDSKTNREVLFYRNSLNKGWILWVLAGAAYALAGFLPVYEYEYSIVSGLAVPLGVGFLLMAGFSALFGSGKRILERILPFLFLFIFCVAGFGFFGADSFIYANPWYSAAYFFAVCASGVTMFFCAYMSKRTQYGTEILGRIRGFQTFLETAEKDRLEAMVMENPQYFYEILPYTYVLDVSDKWMKKFETITTEPPTWYYSSNNTMFDVMMFHHFMNSTMTSATSAMTSTPSSSSGGGFSGGGSGGGGGGAW